MDYFTPVVDSPFDFGRIAAANALSDIYAMGGEPLFALNIAGFPTKALPLTVLHEILRGGAEVAREAGIPVLGGHSADFDVPVYGMAITGRAKVCDLKRNVGARPGDVLVLTKAIGTGILTSAMRASVLQEKSVLRLLKKGEGPSAEEEGAAVASMVRLNRDAARSLAGIPVSAVTDVTGYGLLGHLREMLEGSGVDARITVSAVPLLPGARRLSERGMAPDGSRRNREAIRPLLDLSPGVTETDLLLLCDAQTSGGLLVAVGEERAPALLSRLKAAGDAPSAAIGRLEERAHPSRATIRLGP